MNMEQMFIWGTIPSVNSIISRAINLAETHNREN